MTEWLPTLQAHRQMIEGSIFIVLGLYFLLCRRWIGLAASRWQANLWHIRCGPKIYEISFVLAGVLFIVLGLLQVAGIITST